MLRPDVASGVASGVARRGGRPPSYPRSTACKRVVGVLTSPLLPLSRTGRRMSKEWGAGVVGRPPRGSGAVCGLVARRPWAVALAGCPWRGVSPRVGACRGGGAARLSLHPSPPPVRPASPPAPPPAPSPSSCPSLPPVGVGPAVAGTPPGEDSPRTPSFVRPRPVARLRSMTPSSISASSYCQVWPDALSVLAGCLPVQLRDPAGLWGSALQAERGQDEFLN